MIKTLRITSIIVAIAAVVLLVLPVIYGVRSDPKIEEFLKKPGVVEKLTAAGGQNTAKNDSQNSPLVKQALALGTYFNPPPPPPPKAAPGAPQQGPPQPPTPPAPVAVKFDVVATSYYASSPEKSFVLIDEAGKGLHWVKQGSTLGHVTIETVKDGAIIVRDGSRTSEMTVKVKENWRGLLKNPPPTTRTISTSTSPASANPAAQVPAGRQGAENTIAPSPVSNQGPPIIPTRRTLRPGAAPSATERITPPVQPVPAVVQTPPAAEIAPPPEETVPEDSPAIKEKAAEIDKLMSKMGTSEEMTPEEQKKLDEVFKQLDELGKMRDAESEKDANAKDANK